AVVITIKSGPSTITVLHAEQPLNAAANSTFHTLFVRELDSLQGHQDERRVVHVGIIVIAEFKRPAARFGVFVFYLPIPRTKNLFRQDPSGRLSQRRMIRCDPCFFKRNHGDTGIPARRNARLQANGSSLLNFEPKKLFNPPPRQWIVGSV